MLHTHSTIISRQRPPHPATEPILLADVSSAGNPAPHAVAAIRMALGDRATAEERHALARAVVDIVALRNGALLSDPFDGSTHLHLIIEGWAYRAHVLHDGARQITDVLVRGDICDWACLVSNEEIRASGPVHVAVLRRTMDEHDRHVLAARRDRTMLGDISRLRAQLTSLGRRDAQGRVAYYLVDLHRRLERVGLAKGGAFACPLTQEQLADLLGLTPVHVNRVVQGLRRDGLLMFEKRQIAIPDLNRLRAIAGWPQDIDEGATAAPDRRHFGQPREDDPMVLASVNRNRRGPA